MYLSRSLSSIFLFDSPNDKGGGGGVPPAPPKKSNPDKGLSPFDDSAPESGTLPPSFNADESDDSQAKEIAATRADIETASSDVSKSEEFDSKQLDYFDDVDEDSPEEPDSPETPETTDEGEAKTKEPDSSPDEGGDESEKYYDPEQHAEGKDVFPNAYNSRKDAEHGIANKLELYQEKIGKLEEVESEVGSTVPHSIQEKIKSYNEDITKLADASDEDVRELIVDLDMSLKAVDAKHERVSQSYNTTKEVTEAQSEFEDLSKEVAPFVEEIGVAERVQKEDPAEFEGMLAIVDDQISKELKPLKDAIKKHENDDTFLENHSQSEYVTELRKLEDAHDQRSKELHENRQKLINWNDARVKWDSVQAKQEKSKPMSTAEKRQKAANVFDEWAADRSEGPFALDIFKAPTEDPVKYLLKWASAPANFERFDLTTKAGWDQAHEAMVTEQQERWQKQQAAEQTGKKENKRSSSQDEPIPPPDNNVVQSSPGSLASEMQKVQEENKRLSKQIFG